MIKIIPYISYNPITTHVVDRQMQDLSSDERVVFIVPESVKAAVERMVFDKLTAGRDAGGDIDTSFGSVSAGTLNVDVSSFVRLSYKILSLVGKDSPAGDQLLRNVIYRVLTEERADYPNLNKLRTHFEYIDMLVDLIGDFHRYGISPEKIEEFIAGDDKKDDKLTEVASLIKRADELGREYGLPVNETLPDMAYAVLCDLLSGKEGSSSGRYVPLKAFLDSRFVITGLGSTRNLTPQEIRLIKALSDAGSEVTVYAAVSDDKGDGSFSEFGRNTVSVLESVGGKITCDPVDLNCSGGNCLNSMAAHYAMGDIDYRCEDDGLDDDGSVELISYTMPDDAVSYIANEINRLVRTEKMYRFSDIRIFCADDSYKERIKSIFSLFDLQMFIDKKVILLNTPVVRFVMCLLDLSAHNYDISDVLKILRTGVLTGARRELVDIFDNWCLRENIRNKDRIFNENFYKLTYEVNGESIEKDAFQVYDNDELIWDGPAHLYENIVKKVLIPLRNITDAIDAKTTVAGKAETLARYIGGLKTEIEALRDEYLKRKESDTALAIVKGYSEIMSLLSSLTSELNEVEITSEQFASLVKTDMKNKASGSIPLCVDSVEISSMESAIYSPCKVLYIIGANSENFPHKSSREGIISSDKLQALGLPDKSQMRSKQEFVETSLLLNSAQDKLVFIISSSDVPSSVFNYLRNSLQKGKEKYPIAAGDFKTPVYGEAVKRNHKADDEKSTQITPEHMKQLLDGRMVCSVSNIEKYNGCPLSYMLDYALRIRVRADGTGVESKELGSLCHSMFEFAMSGVKDELASKSIDEVIDEAVPEYIERLADDYFSKAIRDKQITNPDKYTSRYAVYPGLKVKRIFKMAYPAMLDYCKASGFVPEAFEQKLQDMKNKIEIKTTADKQDFVFSLKGSIDRVDKNDAGLLRVVDYKTYVKKINLNEAADGVQIQLFAYAYALKKEFGDAVIDNVGYIKTYLPTGKDIKEKPFEYICAEPDKYDINKIMDHAYGKLEEACKNIAAGKSPAKLTVSEFEGACFFCDFKGTCGRKLNQTKPAVKGSATEILAKTWKIEKPKGKKGKK